MFVTIPSYVEGLKFDQIEGGGGVWKGAGLNGDLNKRKFFELSRSWKEIKLQVLTVSFWLSFTIVGEWWKEMS